jgi:hypothetical protein
MLFGCDDDGGERCPLEERKLLQKVDNLNLTMGNDGRASKSASDKFKHAKLAIKFYGQNNVMQ